MAYAERLHRYPQAGCCYPYGDGEVELLGKEDLQNRRFRSGGFHTTTRNDDILKCLCFFFFSFLTVLLLIKASQEKRR
jgi:hypothetical protein